MKTAASRLLSLCLLAAMLLSFAVFSPCAFASENGEGGSSENENQSAQTVELNKVTTTLDHSPVAMMPVADCRVAVSSANASLVSAIWYGSGGALSAGDKFDSGKYRIEIRVKANDGYRFSTTSFNGYLNNSSAATTVEAGGQYATISREYEAYIYNPIVFKHPGAETVKEGGMVSYVVSSSYCKHVDWELISPDGQKTIKSGDVSATFPGARADNNGTDKLTINNVTAEMDGWQVRAVFYGYTDDYVTRSRSVTIRVSGVTPKPAESAAPVETESPAESASPTETTAPAETTAPTEPVPTAETPVTTEAATAHVHSFFWNYDNDRHWYECACGAREQEGEHSFTWTELSRSGKLVKEQGVCSICGYTLIREESRNDANIVSSVPAVLMFGGIGGLIVALILVDNKKTKKRKYVKKRR